MNQNHIHRLGNTIGLLIICSLLTTAFIDQLGRHDLPCPLCILQRICFIAVGLCLLMNLKNGIKPSHYGLMTLSAILGFLVALRQIYLHIMPHDPGYGNVILGFHMYVWSAIAYVLINGCVAIALLFEKGFSDRAQKLGGVQLSLMALFLILILANGISTFIECGLFVCPDNPVSYQLLNNTNNTHIVD